MTTRPRDRRELLRWSAAAGGLVVVSAAAITGGILWGQRAPAGGATPQDAHAAPPGCARLPAEVVESAAPGAVLEAHGRGPLPEAASGVCTWSSADLPDTEPRVLTVAFHVHHTDGQDTGQARAAAHLDRLGELDGAAPAPSLGEGALVWPGAATPEAAEAVFRDGNLVVRVWYGGPPYEEAHDAAVAVAEGLAAAL